MQACAHACTESTCTALMSLPSNFMVSMHRKKASPSLATIILDGQYAATLVILVVVGESEMVVLVGMAVELEVTPCDIETEDIDPWEPKVGDMCIIAAVVGRF